MEVILEGLPRKYIPAMIERCRSVVVVVETVFSNKGVQTSDACGVADVRTFAHVVAVGKNKMPNWPSDKLTVLAEHSSIFYDIMTEQLLDAVCP
jgi:hypothetical protein